MIANLDTCPQVTWHSGEFVSITSKRPKFRDNQGGLKKFPKKIPKFFGGKSIITMERACGGPFYLVQKHYCK